MSSPTGACLPLHDHQGMVVLSRMLYSKLGVTSYDIITLGPRDNGFSGSDCGGNNQMDADRDDAHGDKDVRPP